MSLVQETKHGIIDGFDRTDYKKAASIAKGTQVLPILEQVFDLNGHVVSYGRKLAVKCFHEFHGVTYAVKEIRIAEGDVLRPGGHLAANIFEYHIPTDNSKQSLVNRHDWAMTAKMLAAAACFR